MEMLRSILQDVYKSLYQIFGVSLLLAALFMFAYLYARDHGVKETLKKWVLSFREDRRFRLAFFFSLVTALILCKTLFCRTIWGNPLQDVIGPWGIVDQNGALYAENIENVMLTAPFSCLLLLSFPEHFTKKGPLTLPRCLGAGAGCAFCLSLCIELSQLFFKLGAIQVTDLAYNTLGGALGGAAYWLIARALEKRAAGKS